MLRLRICDDFRPQVTFFLIQIVHFRPFQPFHHHPDDVLGELCQIFDPGYRTDPVQIPKSGVGYIGILLGYQKYHLVCLHCGFQRFPGFLPADIKMHDHGGQYRHAAKCNGRYVFHQFTHKFTQSLLSIPVLLLVRLSLRLCKLQSVPRFHQWCPSLPNSAQCCHLREFQTSSPS